ncbi:DUF2612 domain-containing protein [Acutalibacter sp. 1XD8-36]|jgi:hypothetical protein|uniref:DUF2612 domain-containing protein n=1 Tax=Acutalibacter sp. 1XD8-36 TaxID=2320852 RepID=UPI0014131B4D|nr:DUF2612 domain-containing protein [Acutalibacter sp. 1XD8-36]NBJ88129.1 DUF2612 domain-containing protein [Acutalibacter sp. 1XD8-36]
MPDYVELLRGDLVEQFKEKPVIDALVSAIGEQLNDVRRFYEDLRDRRGLQTSMGQQLDGVGDIVVLSRLEAGALACINESVYVLDDESYRRYLIFKVWKNTNNCTYHDVIKALRMFWPKPLYYREDPAEPATMVFETDMLSPEDDVPKLLNAPLIKAAGVGIKVIARTASPEMMDLLTVEGLMGRGYTSTVLPEIPVAESMEDTVRPIPAFRNITQTKLPEMEE